MKAIKVDNQEDEDIVKMFRQRQRVINYDATLVDPRSFREELNIYLTRASFGNPVIIKLANGQKLMLNSL